jgi:hypothetical protein
MPQEETMSQTKSNTEVRVKVSYPAPERDFGRRDFLRDLKKASKKQDRSSQRNPEKC